MQQEEIKEKILSNEDIAYQGSQRNGTTSSKTLRQTKLFTSKSPISRNLSPLNQLIEIKNIKNDEFLFRMKLKFIACMQQLEISKQDIESLRKQQGDSDILNFFLNPVKKQFASLKKIKDQYMMKQSRGQLSKNNIKSLQSLEMISLSSQLHEFTQTEKKLKSRCQKLFTQNTQLFEKLKKKQQQNEQLENNLYKTKMLLKQYESVIQNLKQSNKKIEKDFIQQKQRLNEEINGLKEVLLRQREAKQIYLSKLQNLQVNLEDKNTVIKRINDEIQALNKECIKWKNRAQWRETQSNQQTRQTKQKIQQLQNQIQILNQNIKSKNTQIQILNKEAETSTQSYNKKLEKIVEEWKTKLIENVQQYELSIEKYSDELENVKKQNLKIKQDFDQQIKQNQLLTNENLTLKSSIDEIKKSFSQSQQKVINSQNQTKDRQKFYNKKITDLESIINQLKSELSSKSLLITQLNKTLQQVEKTLKEKKQSEIILTEKLLLLQKKQFNEVFRLKKENEDKLKEVEKLKSKINFIESQKMELVKKLQEVEKQLRDNQIIQKGDQMNTHPFNNSSMHSSIQSVNNSINTVSEQNIPRTNNRFTVQSYEKNDRSKSIRRVFVRSNSINQYLKDHLKQNSQSLIALNALKVVQQSSQKSPKKIT